MTRIPAKVALASAALLLLAAGTAPAHTTTLNTTMTIDHTDYGVDRFAWYGFLGGNQRCIGNRPVRLVFEYGGGERRVVDRGRTSETGSFGLSSGEFAGAAVAYIRAPRHRVSPRTSSHRHVCKGAQQIDS